MSLTSRIQLTTVAWSIPSGATPFVFKVPELIVRARQELQTWESADGNYGVDSLGLWLFFEVRSSYFKEQIFGSKTDRNDILNALKESGTVDFYPDYAEQPLVKYAVKSDDSTVQLLQTRRGLFNPAQTIKMRAASRVNDYPDWLKYR